VNIRRAPEFTVVDLGLLAQNGREYKPTERSRKGIVNVDKIEIC
jgi:hypothetical protein